MPFQTPACDDEARRAILANPAEPLNGIDYLEVSADQTTLRVFFIKEIPLNGFGLPAAPHNVTIRGGVRIRNVRVTEVRRADDNLLEVDVSEPGDFSTYTLAISSASLDPFYAQVDFSFKVACPNRFDCKPRQDCEGPVEDQPVIDYMAKDYASFRQALVDLISAKVPGWTERHEADLGMTLLELLAYGADHLSYYQDAVANEAYLETARQRISVRRHARLIDYKMHDGASARTFVHFHVNNGVMQSIASGRIVLATITRRLGALLPPHPARLPAAQSTAAQEATAAVFETMTAVNVHADLNEIHIYTWGNLECCLPKGSTSMDLMGDLNGLLAAGDFLLLEEVLGPETGLPQDADPGHRQVIRLQSVEVMNDPLLGNSVTRIAWVEADATCFPVCVSVLLRDGTLAENVSVARGNLALADHGRQVTDLHPGDPADPGAQGISVGSRAYRFALEQGPVSWRIPFDPSNAQTPAAALLFTDPAQARPGMVDVAITASGITENDWDPTPDLLANDSFAHVFAVETDNRGFASLRFGDNVYGQSPSDGAFISATYRIGSGTGGNVGADSLTHFIDDGTLAFVTAVRNPLPAWGGIEPETLQRVKQVAPAAFRAEQFRAVTEADYACAAERHPLISKAVARFRWTGSWHTVFISIDVKNREEVTPQIERSLKDWVTRYTLAGYDLEIDPPKYVPLDLEIEICVQPNHFKSDVQRAVLEALSSRAAPPPCPDFTPPTAAISTALASPKIVMPPPGRGFFHPDNFSFGDRLYLSRLYAAIEAVPGLDSALVLRFRRVDEYDPDPARPATQFNLDHGYINIGRLEIVRLDNDPNFPENGTLQLIMRGGK